MVNRIAEKVINSPINFSPKKENTGEKIVSKSEVVTSNIQDTEKGDEVWKEDLSADKAKKMTASLNDFLETTSTKLRYEFHEKLEKYYVTLVDSETDQVVREVPNKKLMDMYASMLEFIGVLIDKKI